MQIKLNDTISYVKGYENPLSCDVAVITIGSSKWLYDVGFGLEMQNNIKEVAKKANIVISHFHNDHMGNLKNLEASFVCLGKDSYDHVGFGNIVLEDMYFEDGRVHIFPLPNTHAKGSLGIEIDSKYIFVGDALCGMIKDKRIVFNSQLLKEEIEVLKNLKGTLVLQSHSLDKALLKNTVIERLEAIYSRREKNNPYIEGYFSDFEY